MNEIHLWCNGSGLSDIVSWEEHLQFQACYYGRYETLTQTRKERHTFHQLTEVVVYNSLWKECNFGIIITRSSYILAIQSLHAHKLQQKQIALLFCVLNLCSSTIRYISNLLKTKLKVCKSYTLENIAGGSIRLVEVLKHMMWCVCLLVYLFQWLGKFIENCFLIK